jgi:hypothetical protein
MSNSYLNIVTFLLTTLFYYMVLKPALPLTLYKDKQQYTNYVSNNYMYLAIYVLLVIIIILKHLMKIINLSYVVNVINSIQWKKYYI